MGKIKEILTNGEKRTLLFVILSAIALIASFFHIGKPPVDAAWVAVILCGVPIIKGALEGLLREFDIKADLLVSIALVASLITSQIFAAGEVAFIMVVGALLEERTAARARAEIEKLVQLTPRTARVLRGGVESIIPTEEVQIGDVLRVLAGETIPADGTITGGQTSVNQAVMTGEPLPVDKGVGDEVFSGTVNQFGTFEMKAAKVGEDSSLQRMIRLVESADAGRAKIVRLADRWATWFVAIALSSAVLTWLVTGQVIRAVAVLVVFCPCALVLATPAAVMAGIGNATKFGILIREGDALERLAQVRRIAFDKTGTLTFGKPSVAAVESFGPGLSREELLSLTASAELRSEHPLGKTIVDHYKSVAHKLPQEPQDFKMIAGRGITATVENTAVMAGNAVMLSEHSVPLPQAMMDKAAGYIDKGCTIIYISVNNQGAGFIALSDTLREDAVKTIGDIKNTGVESILLTGDNCRAASHIAKIAGIGIIHADCRPEDKISVIEQYQSKGEMVCMVGDGVNDAPALKKAYIGVAMGGIGSDIAVEAADVVLVGDDIKYIPHLLSLSQRTMRTIKLNIIFSMLLNFIAVIFAAIGILNPVTSALVHNVGSVAVVVNSSLLLNWKEKYLYVPGIRRVVDFDKINA